MKVFIIDDNPMMTWCLKHFVRGALGPGSSSVQTFTNGISAMDAIASGELPDLIYLDVLLDGPDGFTFLNELVSYSDTARIPVVIVTSLDLKAEDLADYGVVGVLSKETMTPDDIKGYVTAERAQKGESADEG